MPRFLIIGFIILLNVPANAQRGRGPNTWVDTTITQRAFRQAEKIESNDIGYCRDEFINDDPSMSCMTYPDSNFIRRGFGYPTSPWFQVMANNHLYEAQGGYVVIYEIGIDGLLIKTGQVTALSLIHYLAHDGSYLYVATSDGFEVFEGANYTEPAKIGENRLGMGERPVKFSVYGDSIYYYFEPSLISSATQLGILDISDKTNPQVVYRLPDSLYYLWSSPPVKYQNYLIVTGVRRDHTTRPTIYFILNLEDLSGRPQIIDSLNSSQCYLSNIYANRLYVGADSLSVYEFDSSHHLTFRSTISHGRIAPHKLIEYEEGGERYCIFIANRRTIYKARITDLMHPVMVDSIVDPELHGAYLRAINYRGSNVYAMSYNSDSSAVIGAGYGIYGYDWSLSNPNRQIQWIKNHADCERVALYGDNVAYVGTVEDEIFPIDISDINHPRVIEDANNISLGNNPKVFGNVLITRYYYESVYYNRISAFSLDDPFHPDSLWVYTFPQDHGVVQVELQDSLLIVSHHRGWPTDSCHLEIINMINPFSPEILCDTILGFVARYFYMDYPRLYFIDNDYERLRAISISDPRHPSYLGNYIVGNNQTVQAIANSEYMYVYDQLHTYIYDLSQFGSYSTRIMNTGGFMDISDRFMFFCGFSEIEPRRGIYAWDITNNPTSFELSAYTYYSSQVYTYMKANFPYVFLTGGYYGLAIFEYGRTSNIEENNQLPANTSLLLNAYPNPFNGQVKFSISSQQQGNSRLDIYDIMGREVWSTSDIEQNGDIVWQAVDQSGRPLPSGIYFARLTQGENQVSRKIVLLK